jgi:hypothetical protein
MSHRLWRTRVLAVVPAVWIAAVGGCHENGVGAPVLARGAAGDDASADAPAVADAGSPSDSETPGSYDAPEDVPVQVVCPPAPPVDLNAVPGLAQKCTRLVYVAGTDTVGEVAVSFDDAAHWQTQFVAGGTGPSTDNIVFGLGYGFADGSNHSLITTNATSWVETKGPTPSELAPPVSPYTKALAFVNGMFVFVAANTGSGYSFNGTDWFLFQSGDPYSTGALANFHAFQIAYGNGIYLVVGQSTNNGSTVAAYRTSKDGENWSDDIQLGAGFHGYLSSVAFGAGEFVVVGRSNGDTTSPSAEGLIAWSSDAKSWTTVTNENPSPLGEMHFMEVARSDTLFVAANGLSDPPGQWWSADGIHWTANPMAPNVAHLSAFENHFIGGQVGGQPRGMVVVSDDGKTWTPQPAILDNPNASVNSVGIGRVLK